MTPKENPYHNPESFGFNTILVEFVDAAHPVTDEERNRPRYGRPTDRRYENNPPSGASASPAE
jgi:hypothetical protein